MVLVLGYVIWIDENILEVHYYTYIEEVRKDIVYKLLKSYKSISKAKRYNCLFERSIVSVKSYFLFIIFCNTHQVIDMLEINFSIDVSFSRQVENIRYQKKQISILLYDMIEFLEVDIQVQEVIFFFTKSISVL